MKLTHFIEDNKEEIADEWVAYARKNINAADNLDLDEIRDHIISMLTVIAEDMQESQTDSEQQSKSEGNKGSQPVLGKAAKEHGAQRLDVGFDIVELSSEFRALRASVLRLWLKKCSQEIGEDELEEMMRFNEAIDEAWMYSLEKFHNQMDESKNWFLAVLGHDLRNPLAAILGVQQILKLSTNLTEKEKNLVNRTDASAKRMKELINNLLELTNLRLGSGMNIEKTNINLSKQSEEIVQEFQFSYPDAIFHLHTKGPVQGEWDQMRLTQMMTNLIGNALRHGKPGGPVTVSVSGEENNAIFTVHNEGKPIPKEIREKIFEGLYTQNGSNPSSDSYGLGLYIVNEVVDRHNGKISLTSTEAEGTTFKVVLPRS